MTTKMTVTQALRQVLEQADGPLKPNEIAERVVPLAKGLKGKTPKATVAAKLYTEAKREGGFVKRVADGFVFAEPATEADPDSPAVTPGSVVVRKGGEVDPDPKPAGRKRRGRATAAA